MVRVGRVPAEETRPTSVCQSEVIVYSALHSSEIEANTMSDSKEEKMSDLEDQSDSNYPEAIDELEA